jgi:hypothetical protein
MADSSGVRCKALQSEGRPASHQGSEEMNDSARYAKIVAWSDEDGCFIGSAPGLIYGGCHGDDERQAFNELLQIVDEALAIYRQDGRPLPPATAEEVGGYSQSFKGAAE